MTLVLLVGGGISWSASRMLRDLADEQGKARVQLAATTAREDLRRIGEDARAAARALADRPTLQRLLAEGQHDALPPFLRRSCEADALDACAVLSGTHRGRGVRPGARLAADRHRRRRAGRHVPGAAEHGARAAASGRARRCRRPEPAVYVVRRLDEQPGAAR